MGTENASRPPSRLSHLPQMHIVDVDLTLCSSLLYRSQQYRKTHAEATAGEASSEAKSRENSIFTTAESLVSFLSRIGLKLR